MSCHQCDLLGEDCQWVPNTQWDQDPSPHGDIVSRDHQSLFSNLRQHSSSRNDSEISLIERALTLREERSLTFGGQNTNALSLGSSLPVIGPVPSIDLTQGLDTSKLHAETTQATSLVSNSPTVPKYLLLGPKTWNADTAIHKRNRPEDEEHSSYQDTDRPAAKRSKYTSSVSEKTSISQFACPYRKHNPSKYNLKDWRSCVLTGHGTIARVKGHLYRYHRVIQCPRCKTTFKTQDDLESHQQAPESCNLKEGDVLEGFTATVEKKLRSRKKLHPNQTPNDQWGVIYKLLFHGENVLSPYFEPINEDFQLAAEMDELGRFYAYSHNNLSGLICGAIDTICSVNKLQMNSILKTQIPVIVRECQQAVFLKYTADADN